MNGRNFERLLFWQMVSAIVFILGMLGLVVGLIMSK
jgi:hypothetical protein